jgi:hypothetical protein
MVRTTKLKLDPEKVSVSVLVLSLALNAVDKRHLSVCQITLKPLFLDDEHVAATVCGGHVHIAHDEFVSVMPRSCITPPPEV